MFNFYDYFLQRIKSLEICLCHLFKMTLIQDDIAELLLNMGET